MIRDTNFEIEINVSKKLVKKISFNENSNN